MAQRDKVKELVGRGLDSYHTKALQQMDRIEKKNKEQNHKISILSNELDNDYLTKTEEGSVISLEHSKEGMIYLDELQGNTLVNYCTDGSKEMTLNGDIDVEGTFVTTTEGVDNGKVDVMCEGNTLVNLVDKMWNNTQTYYTIDENYITILDSETDHRQGYYTLSGGQLNLIKPNTTYTIIAEITKNTLQRNFTLINNFQANGGDITSDDVSVPIGFVGRYVGKFTTLSDFTNRNRLGFSAGSGNRGEITLRNNFIILEGDWTNRDIPVSYFKGMKSVGQDDTNGHKIEILSNNINLFNGEWELGGFNPTNASPSTETTQFRCANPIKVEPNTRYSHSSRKVIHYLDKDLKQIGGYDTRGALIFDTPSNCHYIKIRSFQADFVSDFKNFKYILVKGENMPTTHIDGLLNKKEILMNEPLRGIDDRHKDRIVKIGEKWYIERNTMELDMGSVNFNTYALSEDYPDVFGFYYTSSNITSYGANIRCICNILPNVYCGFPGILNHNIEGIDVNGNHIKGSIYKTKLTELTTKGLKEYFSKVGAKIVYRLNAPIYEPLEIEPTLNTYTDTTHISNNSTIPCNMKVKNSGYNAIIKPSTLYTVALDTNKSGTIGMNLGGTKSTTTNNVATITTPATLTDNSLRLHGKGIKGSKVRLLEGDKTNWIPSHFEGMKSSFEDKFDTTDNTYKMEILSNNKNLFNLDNFELGSYGEIKNGIITVKNPRQGLYDSAGVFKLKTPSCFKGKWITLSTNKTQGEGNIEIRQYDISNNQIWVHVSSTSSFKVLDSCEYISLNFNSRTTGTTTSWENIQIEISNSKTSYIEPKSNKIQFSSIEPLRSVGDVKDRYVFKDGKLMIERNCGETILNGSENWWKPGDISDLPNIKTEYFATHTKSIVGYTSGVEMICDNFTITSIKRDQESLIPRTTWWANDPYLIIRINRSRLSEVNATNFKKWLSENPVKITYKLSEPTYEEIPFELQKIILEGYENGTLFFDTNIPPTSTVTYAGETPIVKSVKLNKTEVLNNTEDINDNIIPYLMDMDYRVVMLQLATEELEGGVSMARLFGGTYEMIKRDILSKRLTREEYGYRLADYYNVGKLTEEQVRELEDLR